MRFITIISAIVCVGLTNVSFAKAAEANEWTTFQGNNGHTGFANVVVKPERLRVIWTRRLSNPDDMYTLLGNPIATSQGVYLKVEHLSAHQVGSQLIALNPDNGETRWQTEMVDDISEPAYSNRKIYLLSRPNLTAKSRLFDERLQAYDAQTGKLVFSSPILLADWAWFKQTPVVDNNQVFIGGSHTQFSFNGETGKLNWKSGDVDGDAYTASVSSQYLMRVMYNALALLDRENGALIATIGGVDTPISTTSNYPVVFDEKTQTAFTQFPYDEQNTRGGSIQLTAYDIENKYVKWTLPLIAEMSQMAYVDDTLFFIKRTYYNDKVYAVNAVTGNLSWSWQTIKPLSGEMIVTPNAIIMGTKSHNADHSNDNVIYILSRETHALMGVIPIPGPGHMAVAGNVLYVANWGNINSKDDKPIGTVTAIQLS